MADIRRIPFTEIVERAQIDLARDKATSESKYKGRVNDVYQYDIPSQIDWRHVRKTGEITTVADTTTGYITDLSATTVTGDSDALWTSANSNNLLLKVNGYDEIYRVTYVSGTSLTIDRTWIGDAISSDEVSYTLYQDRYALASDYDHMIIDTDRAVYYYDQGNRVYLDFVDQDEFEDLQVTDVGDPTRHTIKWLNGSPYLYIDVPDTQARTLFYNYIPTLKRMDEYTTGTITTLANAGTAVTASGSDLDGFITDTTNYDYFFRIDGDGTGAASKWYAIASVTDDTHLTLSDAYGGTAIVAGSATYTVSIASRLPAGLDNALMYGTAMISAIDQDNELQLKSWGSIYGKIISQYQAIEGKKDFGKQRLRTIYEKPGVRR